MHELPGRRHSRRQTGPPPGRFNDADYGEALRIGVVASFMCRWCDARLTAGAHGGTGVVCPTCDLAR